MIEKLFNNHILFPLLVVVLTACTAATFAPAQEETSTLPPATLTPDPVTQGGQVFARICAECHGESAEGYANDLNAPALNSTEHAFHHPDQQIHDWIVNGKLGVGQ